MTVKELIKRADAKAVYKVIEKHPRIAKYIPDYETFKDVFSQIRVLQEKPPKTRSYLFVTPCWDDGESYYEFDGYFKNKKSLFRIPMMSWRKLLALEVITANFSEDEINEVVAFLIGLMCTYGTSFTAVNDYQRKVYSEIFENKKGVISDVMDYVENNMISA